jgi:hypothetical protein
METKMRLLTLAAGAAFFAMGSAVAASTDPATTAIDVELVPLLPTAHEAAGFGISVDDKVETPLIRTAGSRHG